MSLSGLYENGILQANEMHREQVGSQMSSGMITTGDKCKCEELKRELRD
jgi:hypothetical protein